MNTAIATRQDQPRSVLHDMAARFGMEPQAFELTVRATCSPAPKKGEQFRPLTREEFAAFLLVAREYKLNPITREIFAYPKRGGGVVPIVSIDGWVNLVNSHPACDGFKFDEVHEDNGKLYSCECTIYRKDRTHPTAVTEYLSECWRDTDPWKMAHRMLRHKSLIQCARYAFGFAGIFDEEEGQRVAENRLTPLPDVRQAPRPPRPDALPAGTETPAEEAEQDEGPMIDGVVEETSVAGAEETSGAETDPDVDWSFFDQLRDRLTEAPDAETVEEIWTEMDPMARFQASEDDQKLCLNIKNRRLRALGVAVQE